MRIVRSVAFGAVVTSVACSAFRAGETETPPAPAATASDAGDATTANQKPEEGGVLPAELDGSPEAASPGPSPLVRSQAVPNGDLGAGPDYTVQFPQPTTVGNLPMIAIASGSLQLPNTPTTGASAWALAGSAEAHIATAVYIGPTDVSVSKVSFSFSSSPPNLVVVVMEWKLTSAATYTAVTRSSSGTSSVSFASMAAEQPELAKNPAIIDVAGVNIDRVTALPSNGFLNVASPVSSGKVTLLTAYRTVADTTPYAASYALDGPTDYDAVSLKYHAVP